MRGQRYRLPAAWLPGGSARLTRADEPACYMSLPLSRMPPVPTPSDEIVLVHSSDLHVDENPAEPSYGDDGTTGLRVVLEAARAHDANFVLLVGDIFDHNRQPTDILERTAMMLEEAGRPIVILPGNHDP